MLHSSIVNTDLVQQITSNMVDAEKPTTVGELKLSDLPPIEDLHISVSSDELVKVGKVLSIVDVLVVVESVRSMPPLDLDSILFRADGKPLGPIFDVFGPITLPHYSIRFNSSEQIKERNIEKDMDVYFMPETTRKITKFAFVNEIKKIKGTDASWEHDNEPPEGLVEYSDDEEEEVAKRNRRAKLRELHNQAKPQAVDNEVSSSEVEDSDEDDDSKS